MSGDVCFVVGARPNFMKVAPVFRALGDAAPEIGRTLLHTGQHYDREMSRVFIEGLGLPEPDVFLGVGSGTHAEQTAAALVGIEQVLVERRPRLVVVAGDVNSTLAAALAAVKLRIPVAHIEAGLRSFDESMPEEHNRRLTDHVSRLLFAHSDDAVEQLRRESILAERIHLVGNTMIDSLLEHVDSAVERAPWRAFDVESGEYGLVTLHRPALVDDDASLSATVHALVRLSAYMPVLFPVHPRTNGRLTALSLEAPLRTSDVRLSAPLDYSTFLGLEARAAFVVTDSGGIQEETSALGVPCFTLRDTTERPVTVRLGTNVVLGARPDRLDDVPELLRSARRGDPIPLWDGHAGARVAAVLARALSDSELAARAAS